MYSTISPVLAGKRIVIVEEEVTLQIKLRNSLTKAGVFVVGQATTGQQALAMIPKKKPDIVIMDVTLPDIDGIEVTRNVLPQCSALVVLMIGNYEAEYKEKAEDVGACGYFQKPIPIDALIRELERCYQQNSPT